MSTATPTPADEAMLLPLRGAFLEGRIDRRDYWHAAQDALKAAHPEYSGHDATRVARILAPFPLRDSRYAPR